MSPVNLIFLLMSSTVEHHQQFNKQEMTRELLNVKELLINNTGKSTHKYDRFNQV